MRGISQHFRLVKPIIAGGLLSLAVGYSSLANAAQGCGYGYHMTGYGRCVPNAPGPNAVAAPGRPGCWYNGNGYLRCFR